MTAASSAKAVSTPNHCDATPAAARMKVCPTRLVATRSPSADPRLVSSTRSTTQSMVVVCVSPRANPSTDIASIIGVRLWLSATIEKAQRRDHRGDHSQVHAGDPADEKRCRRPRQQCTAGADAQQDADLRRRQPDGGTEQRHIDQEEVVAALRGEARHQGGGHSPQAQQPPHTLGLACSHGRLLDAWCASRATATGRPPTNTQAATMKGRRRRAEAGVLAVADDHAAEHGPDDLAKRGNRCQRAESADARERTLRLGHDALPADGGRHVSDAECGGGERERRDRLHEDEGEGADGGDRRSRAPSGSRGGDARSSGRSRRRAASAERRNTRPSGRGWCRRRRAPAAGMSTPGAPA